jgi:hypothetical protein
MDPAAMTAGFYRHLYLLADPFLEILPIPILICRDLLALDLFASPIGHIQIAAFLRHVVSNVEHGGYLLAVILNT